MSEPVLSDEPGEGEASSEQEGGRHRAREVALQVLYAIDLGSKNNRPLEEEEEVPAPSVIPSGPASMRPGAGRSFEGRPNSRDSEWVGTPAVPQEVFDRVTQSFPVPKTALVFANKLVEAVVGGMDQIDALLGEHARNWRVSRMAAVDRNVLRLAAYELRDTDTPVAVVIDEAVDLARRFGSDTSPSFVNGVLDGLAREVRGE